MAIKRLFVANRGEIALRIIKTAKKLGIETVIGVSMADRETLAAKLADRTVVLGPATATKSYLRTELIVHAAMQTGCDALHPGYGFLSEKPELCRLCEEHELSFVGPRADTIESLGDKLSARRLAHAAGVKTVPGTDHVETLDDALKAAEQLGYPVVMKASAGGGGRGMFKAASAQDLKNSFHAASLEAESAFGDGRLYIECFVERARHVEVQIVGDGEGRVIHFGERDCTVQRRYQKLIEEAPAASLNEELRARVHGAAVQLTSHAKYRNAGTVEFLFDVDRQDFYFMEVNSRIQVEHPVTEEITGQDLIEWQLLVAGGEGLKLSQDDIVVSGHAIECRINAEDPSKKFAPSPARVSVWRPPFTPGVRLDSHVEEGYLIPPYYDSMIGKLIVRGKDRAEAINRLISAIDAFEIDGPKTTLPLARFIVDQDDFRSDSITTRWLEDNCLSSFEA